MSAIMIDAGSTYGSTTGGSSPGVRKGASNVHPALGFFGVARRDAEADLAIVCNDDWTRSPVGLRTRTLVVRKEGEVSLASKY